MPFKLFRQTQFIRPSFSDESLGLQSEQILIFMYSHSLLATVSYKVKLQRAHLTCFKVEYACYNIMCTIYNFKTCKTRVKTQSVRSLCQQSKDLSSDPQYTHKNASHRGVSVSLYIGA